MATIYRKVYPVPMPDGAEILTRRGESMARWTDGNGKVKTAPLAADGRKVLHEADCWYARYTDADGCKRRVSTGCRDEQAARKVLSDLLAQVEKVRCGILTPEENHAARHAARPIVEHIADYLAFLKVKTVRGRKVSAAHRYDVEKQLIRLVAECGFRRLGDITRQRVTKWLADETDKSEKAPRTVQKYRASLMAFCKWAVREGRLSANPLAALPAVAVDEDRRRRRPLTLDEIDRLLDAAATRPLRETPTIRRGARRGQEVAKVGDAERERLVELGRERALIYKTLIYTGLRKSELASLTVADLHLDAAQPYVELAAKNAKSGRGARLPLRADLAEELCEHLAGKTDQQRQQTRRSGRSKAPMALPANMPLFRVPRDLVRILDRDLTAAGIPKTDADGRTVDVHCLRHTFATLLSKAGVVPRIAQELMRHSDIRLTMNTYTHLQLVDTAGAVEAMPSIGAPQRKALEAGRHGRMLGFVDDCSIRTVPSIQMDGSISRQ